MNIPYSATSTPLISIITVTYNAERELKPTLESLQSQDFKDFEHIIVDGLSKDDTLRLATSYGYPGMKIISEKDNGLYDAMNKGLRLAKSKYVLFLNAGDSFYDSSILGHYADAAKNDPDIIYGDTVVTDIDGKILRKRHLDAPSHLTFRSFSQGMLICHQAFMVKKALTPLYDLQYRFSADYDWCLKCIKKAEPDKCINLREVTIKYLDGGLTNKNHRKSLKERFVIMSRNYGFIPTLLRHFKFLFR